jgi:hypothetical protein
VAACSFWVTFRDQLFGLVLGDVILAGAGLREILRRFAGE